MNRLRELIVALNLTQTAFALELGIAKSTVSDVINGRLKDLPNSVQIRLIREYNVNAHWLLTGEGEMFLQSKENGAGINNSGIYVSGSNNIGSINSPELNKDEQILIQKFRKNGYVGLHTYIKKLLNLSLIFLAVYKTIEYIMM